MGQIVNCHQTPKNWMAKRNTLVQLLGGYQYIIIYE